jgi:hypothetical protein
VQFRSFPEQLFLDAFHFLLELGEGLEFLQLFLQRVDHFADVFLQVVVRLLDVLLLYFRQLFLYAVLEFF